MMRTRLEIFTAVKIHVVLCVVTTCSDVAGRNYTVSQHGIPRNEGDTSFNNGEVFTETPLNYALQLRVFSAVQRGKCFYFTGL